MAAACHATKTPPSQDSSPTVRRTKVFRSDCPAVHDCWLTTTQGWLFHLSDGSSLPRDEDPAFARLITYRPPDEGVPQVVPDAPPADDSGILGEPPPISSLVTTKASTELRIAVPLLSDVHTRLVHGSALELRFKLAVKARGRLIAKRRQPGG